MIRFLFLISFFCLFTIGEAQNSPWPRIYGDDKSVRPKQVWETYDKGFLITSWHCLASNPTTSYSALLIKADINGEMLWEKHLLAPFTTIAIKQSALTKDGGVIITGLIKDTDPEGDPFLIKLNACGKKEWCKIFHTPSHADYAYGIVSLPDGGYIFNWVLPTDDIYQRNALVKVDEYGEIQWKTIIPEYTNATVKTLIDRFHEIKILQDDNILLAGQTRVVDPEDSTHLLHYRPIWLKVSPDGGELWKQTWRPYDQMFWGWIEDACQLPSGDIYSPGRVFGSPFLFKVSNEGDTLLSANLNPNSSSALASTISAFADNSLVIGMGYGYGSDNMMVAILTDTLGNILEERILIDDTEQVPRHGNTTHDNYALILTIDVTGNNADIVLFKMDENLEDAPFDYGNYTYDSLCPHPITSDTIWVTGDTVGIEELKDNEKTELQIMPNPASSQVKIVLPEYITEQLNTNGVSFSHTQYQFKGVLEVFNLQGQLVHSVNVRQGETVNMDITHWPKGLYGLRLVVKGRKEAVGKLVKE